PAAPSPPLSEFQMQPRDLWISPGDIGFWQGAIRDLADQRYPTARRVIETKSDWIVDLLYGDQDGGQRAITRFRCQAVPGWSTGHSGESPPAPGSGDSGSGHPDGEDGVWLATVVRHWTLDQPDPRSGDRTNYTRAGASRATPGSFLLLSAGWRAARDRWGGWGPGLTMFL